jgi:hypothetical protein
VGEVADLPRCHLRLTSPVPVDGGALLPPSPLPAPRAPAVVGCPLLTRALPRDLVAPLPHVKWPAPTTRRLLPSSLTVYPAREGGAAEDPGGEGVARRGVAPDRTGSARGAAPWTRRRWAGIETPP